MKSIDLISNHKVQCPMFFDFFCFNFKAPMRNVQKSNKRDYFSLTPGVYELLAMQPCYINMHLTNACFSLAHALYT